MDCIAETAQVFQGTFHSMDDYFIDVLTSLEVLLPWTDCLSWPGPSKIAHPLSFLFRNDSQRKFRCERDCDKFLIRH